MAFREVAMFEVKEVIRLFGEGVPKKAIARHLALVRTDRARSHDLATEPNHDRNRRSSVNRQ